LTRSADQAYDANGCFRIASRALKQPHPEAGPHDAPPNAASQHSSALASTLLRVEAPIGVPSPGNLPLSLVICICRPWVSDRPASCSVIARGPRLCAPTPPLQVCPMQAPAGECMTLHAEDREPAAARGLKQRILWVRALSFRSLLGSFFPLIPSGLSQLLGDPFPWIGKPRHWAPSHRDHSRCMLSPTCVAPPISALRQSPLQSPPLQDPSVRQHSTAADADDPLFAPSRRLPTRQPCRGGSLLSWRCRRRCAAPSRPDPPHSSLIFAPRAARSPRPGRNVNVLPSRSRKNAVPSGAERTGPQ